MTFDEWMKSGPLANEPVTERMRTMLNLAWAEGGLQQNEQSMAAVLKILQSPEPGRGPANVEEKTGTKATMG